MENYRILPVKPVWLILLLAVFTALFVFIGGVAYAADLPEPADEKLVALLLPDYHLESGVMKSENQMLLLMRNTQDELVFVGACYDESEWTWMLTESTPLPEGTVLGVENFVYSLGIPSEDYYSAIDVNAFSDGSWGVTGMYPRSGGLFQLGQNWISEGIWPLEGAIGSHPWSDITKIDWQSMPQNYTEAMSALDTSVWAVVHNPNPKDRLNLREKNSASSGSLGKYYNGTPVRVLSRGEEWTKVEILGVRGYMMTKYLAFGDDIHSVSYAGPRLMPQEERTYLSVYDAVNERGSMREIQIGANTGFYVLADLWGEWYHVWFYDLGMGGSVHQTVLWAGNG